MARRDAVPDAEAVPDADGVPGADAVLAEGVLGRLRERCLALPEVTERLSHGSPAFFVRGRKTFVMFLDDHHGDGILGIWCAARPPGPPRPPVAPLPLPRSCVAERARPPHLAAAGSGGRPATRPA